MNEEQTLGIGDLRGVLQRRFGVAAGIALAIFLVAIFVAAILPNKYTAAATLLVEPQTISKNLVEPGLAESDLNNRLHLMTMQILSRPRLSRVIDELGLFPEESEHMTREEVIELMRSRIGVEPVLPTLDTGDKRPQDFQINTFRLTYTADSPRTAAAVVNRLAQDFIDEHIRERVQISGDTSEFIERELQRLTSRMREIEAQTAQVKAENPGRLPEERDTNERLLERAIENLRSAQRDLAQARSDEGFYRQQATQAAAATPGASDVDPVQRVELLKIQLGQYRARGYTDKHPDIRITLQEIEDLEERIERGEASDEPIRSLAQQQADAEAQRAALRVAAAQADIERLQAQVEELEQRLAGTPRVEEQLAALENEYEGLSESFEDYSRKRFEALTQANMERSQKGEQFRLLESAIPPTSPSSPRRLIIVVTGLLLGVALGGGVGLVLESMDSSFHGSRDLQQKLGVPVLAEIPSILLDADRAAARRRQLRTAVGTAAVVLAVLVGSGAGYVYVNVLPRRGAGEGAAPEATEPAPAAPTAGIAPPGTGG